MYICKIEVRDAPYTIKKMRIKNLRIGMFPLHLEVSINQEYKVMAAKPHLCKKPSTVRANDQKFSPFFLLLTFTFFISLLTNCLAN